jgi:mono/diheme cytochrome c family protein
MKFLTGIVVGAGGLLVAGYLVAMSGRISVAATSHGGWNDRVDDFLSEVSDKSVARHAPKTSNPLAKDPSAVPAGMAHYKENCLDCHGARDVDTSEFAKGLNPAAPMLDMKDVQEMSDGELYWIVSNGIRSTGMPAFSPTHSPEEIWKIVAFVRHLPHLTNEEVSVLKGSGPEEAEHHAAASPVRPTN